MGTMLSWFLYLKDLMILGKEQGARGGVEHSVWRQGVEVRNVVDDDSELEEIYFVASSGTKAHLSERCEGLRNATSRPAKKTLCSYCKKEKESKASLLKKKRTGRPLAAEPGAE